MWVIDDLHRLDPTVGEGDLWTKLDTLYGPSAGLDTVQSVCLGSPERLADELPRSRARVAAPGRQRQAMLIYYEIR